MDHEGEEFEEVHFDDDEEEPMDSDGEDNGDDEDRNAQYGDEEEIENGWNLDAQFLKITFKRLTSSIGTRVLFKLSWPAHVDVM